MKNLIKLKSLFILCLVICITSCGNEQPILNDSANPFIVSSAEAYNETHTSYYNTDLKGGTVNNVIGSWYARIVLPTGMYNVGDTIMVSRCCR